MSEAARQSELLQAATQLVNWLNAPGRTNKSRRGRVPAKMLERLETAIILERQSSIVNHKSVTEVS